jgi:hypothetical protein
VCDLNAAYSGNAKNFTVYSSKCVPLMGKKNVTLTSFFQLQKNRRLDPNSAKAQEIILSIVRFVCKDLRTISMVEGENYRGAWLIVSLVGGSFTKHSSKQNKSPSFRQT